MKPLPSIHTVRHDENEVLTLTLGGTPPDAVSPGRIARALHAALAIPGEALAWLLPEGRGIFLIAIPQTLSRRIATPLTLPIPASLGVSACIGTLRRPTDPFEMPAISFELIPSDAGPAPTPGAIAAAIAGLAESPIAAEDLGPAFLDGSRVVFQLPPAANLLANRIELTVAGRTMTMQRIAA